MLCYCACKVKKNVVQQLPPPAPIASSVTLKLGGLRFILSKRDLTAAW